VGADGGQGNLTLLVAVSLLLGVAASVAGEVVTIRFAPESAQFAEAWALARSKEERAQRFREIVDKNQRGG
jgi:hypothetical protein